MFYKSLGLPLNLNFLNMKKILFIAASFFILNSCSPDDGGGSSDNSSSSGGGSSSGGSGSGGCGTYSGHTLHIGEQGGCYYINSNGNKTYVDRSYCNC